MRLKAFRILNRPGVGIFWVWGSVLGIRSLKHLGKCLFIIVQRCFGSYWSLGLWSSFCGR